MRVRKNFLSNTELTLEQFIYLCPKIKFLNTQRHPTMIRTACKGLFKHKTHKQ